MGIEAGRRLGFYLSVPGALNLQDICSSGVVRCLSFLLNEFILLPLILIFRRCSLLSVVVLLFPRLFRPYPSLLYHDHSSPNVVPTLFRRCSLRSGVVPITSSLIRTAWRRCWPCDTLTLLPLVHHTLIAPLFLVYKALSDVLCSLSFVSQDILRPLLPQCICGQVDR